MNNRRRKIPTKIELDVMFNSGAKCCVCQEHGDHIHHIDGDNSNNAYENLVLLCFKHHDKASVEKSLSRKLSKTLILKFRKAHYEAVIAKRNSSIQKINDQKISKLTSEDILQASKDAIIILELENISKDYFGDKFNQAEVLNRLDNYINHASNRTAYEILGFLEHAASQARQGMSLLVAQTIYSLSISYFPSSYAISQNKHDVETGSLCIEIGFNLAYDSAIKLRKLVLIPWGLTLWKHVYRTAKKTKNVRLSKKVMSYYDNLESTLQRPERSDLGNALELVRIFREDIDTPYLAFPNYSAHLLEIIEKEGVISE